MNIKRIFLISAAVLLLQASLAPADSGLLSRTNAGSNSKVDPELAVLLESGKENSIPVIVIFKEDGSPHLGEMKVRYRYHLICGVAGDASPAAIKLLAESDYVEGVFLDGAIQIAEPAQSAPGNESICPAQIINASRLWELGIDGRGITVAVLDSGIDKNHPDLAGKVVGEKNFVLEESTSDDLLGHGTMVAGIVAGSGEASGGRYMGVAPGASLLNVKVIDKSGGGRISDIIAGIEWALDNDADILSLSLGGMNLGETNPPVTIAADNAAEAGAVVCVAAGNRKNSQSQNLTSVSTSLAGLQGRSKGTDGIRLEQLQPNQMDSREVLLLLVVLALPPGLIDSPGDGINVITLGASDGSDHIASFSGSGPTRDGRTKPSSVAPGVNVVSTVPPGLENLDHIDIYYARSSGTSLSTPVAAGMAALMLQASPNLAPAGIKAAMTLSAKKLKNTQEEEYEEYYQGTGRLDANQSLRLLNPDLCGVVPDKWNAGRWAYLGAGKGLYVGLDTGADRPQKKIYALAPEDDDSNQLVFFTSQERSNISTKALGAISSWLTVQPLPSSIPANEHRVLGASMTVPNGTLPGEYAGSIDISEDNKTIASIPVSVRIAEPVILQRGRAVLEGRLQDDKWHYYYLDVGLGTSDLKARLSWKQKEDLDLFLLSPTSEYYAGDWKTQFRDLSIERPPSGRWLVAVHARRLAQPVNYTLIFEQSLLDASPKRWNAGELSPGSISKELFTLRNTGLPLYNLSYNGTIESVSIEEFAGSIGYKDLQEWYFDVPEGTSKLSVNMSAEDGGGDIALLLLDPADERIYASVGAESLGSPEVFWPDPGKWRIWIYGNDVPVHRNESFSIEVVRYLRGAWNWIFTKGPTTIDSDSRATIEASLAVPANASSQNLEGFIDIQSDNQSFQIPVSLMVTGVSLEGLGQSRVEDLDNDGYFDRLSLGFEVNVASPGDYTILGALEDCQGNRIKWLAGTSSLRESGAINIDLDGRDIWRMGQCGPLMIRGLFLYNERGDLVDVYNNTITIDRSPEEFQPPAAYLSGRYVNESTAGSIGIGVELRVIKRGTYELSGRIEDEDGEEMGEDSVTATLEPGNQTVTLKFNPAKFKMMGKPSRLFLKDLTLKLDGTVLEIIDDAWFSDVIDPGYFRGGLQMVRTDKGMVSIP